MGNNGSNGGGLLSWIVLIVLALVAFKVATMLLGTLLGLAMFVLFNVLPIVVAIWLLMKVWRHLFPPREDFERA